MSSEIATRSRQLCSVVAKALGEDLIGTAWAVARMLLVEVALPWPSDLFTARGFPAGLGELLTALWEGHPDVGMLAIAPDREHSRAGWSRVIDFTYPPARRAAAQRAEFLVPTERVTEFLAARIAGDAGDGFPGVEAVAFTGRDLLVCTHGTVDACCALFGYPLYRDLRQAARAAGSDVRVWRSTHFGGHRFAPTVLDLPEGRYWGFLTPQSGAALVHRDGSPAALSGSYRGWAGYTEPAEQVLERAALLREGWGWTTWPQECATLERGPRGVLLRITAYPPAAPPIAYEGWVAQSGEIETLTETDGEPAVLPVLVARDVRRVRGEG